MNTKPQQDSAPNPEKFRANSEVIQMWATRTKCWQCRHKFEKPVVLPVEKPTGGKFQPNINPEVLLHVQETHGIDHKTVRKWVIGSVYGMKLNEVGIEGVHDDEF